MERRTIVTVAESTADFTRKGEGDVLELDDGRLLLAYMEFSGDGSDVATTRIVSVESSDRGITWGRHRVLADTDPGDVNVYSPNLIRALDGGILLLFMRQHGSVPRSSTLHAWKSVDGGTTFMPCAEFMARQDCSLCNAVVKRVGPERLLLPVTRLHQAGDNPYGHAYDGTMLRSDDDGKTWREADNRVSLPMRGVMEPHVDQTRDGRVLMVMRNQLGSPFLSESADQGVTWSKPQTTGLRAPESCPELTRIPGTDDLLMIWNNSPFDPAFRSHSGKRSPLTSAISRDEGHTWRHIRDIEDDPARAFSNPGCRFTNAGKAIVNYWTCEYLPDLRMQDVIDLRVALIDTEWFYEES